MSRIALVLGSRSDWDKVKPGISLCRRFQLDYSVAVASAHRSPGLLEKYLEEWENDNVQLIIAVAGKVAHLPGVIASKTLIPVIGVPVAASPLSGQDALYSIVMMPPGVPVATVGIDDIKNAVILAAQILAVHDKNIKKTLEAFREEWQKKILADNEKLQKDINSPDI